MKAIVLACCLAAFPAMASPNAHEIAWLVAADAMIAADVLQSLDIKRHSDAAESNPLLGDHPSDARLIASGAAAGVGLSLLWYAMPDGARALLPAAVCGVEAVVIVGNHRGGLRIRF